MLDGFLEQTRNVLVGVQAAIDRALEEGWSIVLEGVHLVPGMLPRTIEGALVVQCVLAIDDAEAHASHFWIRDNDSDGVRPSRSTSRRSTTSGCIQEYIVGRAQEARRAGDRERRHRGRDRQGDGARAPAAEPLQVSP